MTTKTPDIRLSVELQAEADTYGIKNVPIDVFDCDGFHYSNLRDAVHQSGKEIAPNAEIDADDMAHYGIARSRVDSFHYGAFRYSNIEDAIAEAKRHPTPVTL